MGSLPPTLHHATTARLRVSPTMFTDLAEQAGAPDPVLLGRQLHLLYDGAGLAARMDHRDRAIAPSTCDAVEKLLDAAVNADRIH